MLYYMFIASLSLALLTGHNIVYLR